MREQPDHSGGLRRHHVAHERDPSAVDTRAGGLGERGSACAVRTCARALSNGYDVDVGQRRARTGPVARTVASLRFCEGPRMRG